MFKTIFSYDKREICVLRQSKPTPTNRDLAISFKVRENTVCDILKRRSEYLAINPEDPNSHNKRLRKGKYSGNPVEYFFRDSIKDSACDGEESLTESLLIKVKG
ncbi:15670_t:CDS:2 [Entrophospora sp. SA101]|nr:15670_t:CDS:2 [Entrophospora sp. SA101]